MPGRHNVLNALAVIAVADELGVPWRHRGARARGVRRRRTPLRGAAARSGGILVVDDYGHHPAEIRATLRAAREGFDRRVVVAFQPHRYTRTRDLFDDFLAAFNDADVLLLTDIYAAGEDRIAGVTGERALPGARAPRAPRRAPRAAAASALADALLEIVRPGDLVAALGAGDIYRTRRRAPRRSCARACPSPAGPLRCRSPTSHARLVACARRRVRANEPLARHTSFRIGGPADVLVRPDTTAELAAVVRAAAAATCAHAARRRIEHAGRRRRHPRRRREARPRVPPRRVAIRLGVAAGAAVQLGKLARAGVSRGLVRPRARRGHPRHRRRRTVHERRARTAARWPAWSTAVEGVDGQGSPVALDREAVAFTYRRAHLPRGFVVTAVTLRPPPGRPGGAARAHGRRARAGGSRASRTGSRTRARSSRTRAAITPGGSSRPRA